MIVARPLPTASSFCVSSVNTGLKVPASRKIITLANNTKRTKVFEKRCLQVLGLVAKVLVMHTVGTSVTFLVVMLEFKVCPF